MPADLPQGLITLQANWQAAREIRGSISSLVGFVDAVRKEIATSNYTPYMQPLTPTKGKGVELWLRKAGIEYAFEIKTVQVNANNGNSLNTQLMDWIVWRLAFDAQLDFRPKIVFPYSASQPYTVDAFWQAFGGRISPIRRNEDALVQEEFWDLVSESPILGTGW
ncbi:MAG: TdeIII family type II restriction endonuclease [Chloroflexi bacterium]|nr:TdeIII family type II restriction endonuclease [Chloroflexota bacterium]